MNRITFQTSCKMTAALVLALGAFAGCESTNSGGSANVSGSFYYGVGFSDPWYYGGYYPPDVIVTPPPGRPPSGGPPPGGPPVRPEHPIARPPPGPSPSPRPMPSVPSAPRPMARPAMRR